jgi:hypothetical protein
MAYVEGLRQGSAVLSRVAERNPQQILAELTERDPTASVDRLFKKWKSAIIDDVDLLDAALRHAFTNMLTNIDRGRRGRTSVATRVQQKIEREQAIKQMQVKIERVVLLNIKLPNGKLLRDCSFAECKKAGGWFLKVAKMGRPTQIVGLTLSEEKLQAIK